MIFRKKNYRARLDNMSKNSNWVYKRYLKNNFKVIIFYYANMYDLCML